MSLLFAENDAVLRNPNPNFVYFFQKDTLLKIMNKVDILSGVPMSAFNRPSFYFSPQTSCFDNIFRGIINDIVGVNSSNLLPAAMELKRRIGDLMPAGPCILLGERFTGKSSILRLVAESFSLSRLTVAHVEWINSQDLIGKPLKFVMEIFSTHLRSAKLKAPSILIIDDIDLVCQNPELLESLQKQENQILSKFMCEFLDSIAEHNKNVIRGDCVGFNGCLQQMQAMYSRLKLIAVCFSAQSLSSVNPWIPYKCASKFYVPSVSPMQCTVFLNQLKSSGVPIGNLSKNECDSLQSLLEGCRIGDIAHLTKTISSHVSIDGHTIEYDDLTRLIKSYTPLSLNSVVSAFPPDRTWREVCGLVSAKDAIVNTFMRPVVYKRIYSLIPIRISRAILLYGPPGSGIPLHSIALLVVLL